MPAFERKFNEEQRWQLLNRIHAGLCGNACGKVTDCVRRHLLPDAMRHVPGVRGIHLHHIGPRGRLADDADQNPATLCVYCHRDTHRRLWRR